MRCSWLTLHVTQGRGNFINQKGDGRKKGARPLHRPFAPESNTRLNGAADEGGGSARAWKTLPNNIVRPLGLASMSLAGVLRAHDDGVCHLSIPCFRVETNDN